MRVGIVAKVDDNTFKLINEILNYGSLVGIELFVESKLAEVIRWDKTFVLSRDRLDYIIVIGGDGTVLNTLLALGDDVVPLITIRSGKRAFLHDVSPHEVKEVLDRLVRGDYMLIEYMRLEAICSNGVRLPQVLNEYVITTSGFFRSRVAHLKVFKRYVSAELDEIYDMFSDGLLVSTPIGSSAYNVSIGGPLVDPDLEALVLTPIAPLNLFIRSIVLPPSTEVVVEICRDSLDVDVIADGTHVAKLEGGDTVTIRRSSNPAKFIRFHRITYGKMIQRLFYER